MAQIVLHETGMRDGLQIESASCRRHKKLAWIEQLIASGVDIIQVGSFVHPDKVPPMADTDALFRQLAKAPAGTAPCSRASC